MEPSDRRVRPWELAALLCCAVFLAWWQWAYRGYVKDDAFISMRYARNLAEGLGLVFNPGERLEGYTNFLWVLLLWPAFVLGLDGLLWAKILGCTFGQCGLVVTWLLARRLAGGPDPRALAAPVLWASSSSVVLWSMGGLEPTLMATLCGTALLATLRAFDDEGEAVRPLAAAAGALVLACLCRPDAHALLGVAAASAILDIYRHRRIRKGWLIASAAVLGVLVPYHLFRFSYFGDWLPNTFYVKAAAGPEVYRAGLLYVRDLLGFNANAGIFVGLLFALLLPGDRRARVPLLLASLGFLLYLVKIGRDEMKWFRLYLPVYPAAIALGVDGLRVLSGFLSRPLPARIRPAAAGAFVLLAAVTGAAFSVRTTAEKRTWHSHYVEWSRDSFGAMGRYIGERSQAGDAVVFQDMGAAPFAAPDQRWLDTIGILSGFVAHELAAIELNPFMRSERAKRPGGRQDIQAFDERVRDYMFEQQPKWIAFVAYVDADRKGFARRIREADGDAERLDEIFRRAVSSNTHAHGIGRDARFRSGFRYEAHWQRNAEYWLVLYRRVEGAGAE